MTSKFITFRNLLAAGMLCLLAASCSDGMDGDSDNRLPGGTYPMTFTAAVDGPTATRATTNNGTTSWQSDDPVAISMNGGTSHKVYKITNASSGAMSPNNSGSSDANTLYWSKTQETLAAWHPVGCTIGSGSSSGEVNITDQSSGFGTLENILHSPAKQYSYSNSSGGSNGTVAFTFIHALAKVKVTLQAGDGITADDLSTATVAFMGYTAGTLGYDGLTVASGSANGAIKPNTVTPSDGSGTSTATYTALLIPQQMRGEKFIKVTVGTGDAARDYYYTPASSTDANLEAGKQYAYTITVKKTGLAVTVTDNGVSWSTGTGITGDTPSTVENYTLTITDESNSLSNLAVKGSDGTTITAEPDGSSTYKIPATSGFSVSYVPSDKKQSLIPTSGLCRMKRSGESQSGSVTYTCYYSSVVSDVTLELKEYVEIGDFYYSDGSWSAPFSLPSTTAANSTPPTVIGIVMKVGKDLDGDWKDDCTYKQKGTTTEMSTIHGYVLALHDANNGSTCTWGSNGTKVDKSDMNREQNTGFYGYKNTQAIISFNSDKSGTLSSAFPAAYYATVDYETRENNKYASPDNSSGWFLPSAGQCWYWYQNRDLLLASMKKATGDDSYSWKGSYWSSSEYSGHPADFAWCAYFYSGRVDYGYKGDGFYVRACLAF